MRPCGRVRPFLPVHPDCHRMRALAVAFLAATADGLRFTSRRSALGFGTALLMPGQRALADTQGTPFGPCERNQPPTATAPAP